GAGLTKSKVKAKAAARSSTAGRTVSHKSLRARRRRARSDVSGGTRRRSISAAGRCTGRAPRSPVPGRVAGAPEPSEPPVPGRVATAPEVPEPPGCLRLAALRAGSPRRRVRPGRESRVQSPHHPLDQIGRIATHPATIDEQDGAPVHEGP